MSKTNYTLSQKVGSDGRSQILVRFVAGKNDVWRGKTGVYIKPDNWDKRQNYPRASRRDQADIAECRRVQRRLDDLSRILGERYNEDKVHGKDWLTSVLSALKWNDYGLLSTSKSDFSMMRISDSYELMIATELGNGIITESTAKQYTCVKDKVKAYEDGNGGIRVGDFNTEAFNGFFNFCRVTYDLSDNTISDIRAKLLRWWHWCQRHDDMLPNLKDADKTKGRVYGTPYYFTKEERNKLYHAAMPNCKIESARDTFVFQCLIGCRVSDLHTLTKANIVGDNIVYIAHKTVRSNPVTISVPLHPIAKEIIRKYYGMQKTLVVIDNHKTYDARVRKAIKAAGLDVMLTIRDRHSGQPKQVMLSEVASSHMARRTFIGCLYEAGFRESDICSMSGHKEGSISIQRYRKVSDERKRKMIDSI